MNNPGTYFFVTDSLGNGGQEKQLFLLVKALRATGRSCLVFVSYFNEQDKYVGPLRDLGVPIAFSGSQKILEKTTALRTLINEHHPVFVQSFTFHLNILCFLSCLGTSSIAIGAIRSVPAYSIKHIGIFRSVLNFILPFHTISNNHTSAGILAPYFMLISKRVLVVENGIEITEEPRSPRTDHRFTSISAGRLSAEKNMPLMMLVIKELIDEGYDITHKHLGDGVLRNSLTQHAKDLGITGHFLFTGTSETMNAELSKADLFLHTSDTEGTPNAVIEAMLQGLPVVTTNCGDIPYLIRNRHEGCVCDTGDRKGLADAYRSLFNNQAKRAEMGARARQRIVSEYSLDKYLQKNLTAYGRILNN